MRCAFCSNESTATFTYKVRERGGGTKTHDKHTCDDHENTGREFCRVRGSNGWTMRRTQSPPETRR